MYSDRDGAATAQSQKAYDSRVRILTITTAVLSSIGLGAAILNDEYSTKFQWTLSVWGLHLHPARPLLWVNLVNCLEKEMYLFLTLLSTPAHHLV